MWGPAHWKAHYQARAKRLRELAVSTDDEDARLVLLWAAHDYDVMADGKEPDEAHQRLRWAEC